MDINSIETRNQIYSVMGELRTLARAAKNYKKNTVAILHDDTVSDSFRKSKIDEMQNAYNTIFFDEREKITEGIRAIIPLVIENEEYFSFDIPGFTETLAAIESTSGELPPEAMESVLKKFAGHYQALKAIEETLKGYGQIVRLKSLGYEEYTQRIRDDIAPILDAAENLDREETSVIVGLHDIFKKLIRLGEVRGIEFSEEGKTFGDGVDDEVADIIVSRAMGLE